MSFDLQAYLHDRRGLVDAELARRSTPHFNPEIPDTLQKSMAYSLLAGGKRLRPILVLAGYEAVGGTDLSVPLPAACAVEMIHTYSLIHDDLPAMDNDDFRRGKPTNHKAFGEAMAILGGDGLLTDAFVAAASCKAPAEAVVDVVAALGRAAGVTGMVAGQVIDIEATGKPVDLALLQRIHRRKTGALLSVSVWMGARLGGAQVDSDALARLTTYADALGFAFQIIDDVLDVTQDLATLGKDPGSDKAKGKTTYVDLMGIDGARQHAAEVMNGGLHALATLGECAEPLRALARYTLERKN